MNRPRALVDGLPADSLPLDDRGLAYGDGLFETMLIHRRQAVWWPPHLARLAEGAQRLGIAMPDAAVWAADRDALLDTLAADEGAVLKLVLTRGGGARGYAPAPDAPARRLVSLHPAPVVPAAWRTEGITLFECRTRLARQPLLAGIKHLNRLEQVLARAEWRNPAIAEGLLRDTDGRVIAATAANLFLHRDGRWLTPALRDCGVAGICRAFLLAASDAQEGDISQEMLHGADEVFVCNSVRGILPVTRLGERRWPVGPATRALSRQLARAQPAFAFDEH
ncbi:MAG: aminodeoxychorismate lyase [Lysobacteraceae bacterium]